MTTIIRPMIWEMPITCTSGEREKQVRICEIGTLRAACPFSNRGHQTAQ